MAVRLDEVLRELQELRREVRELRQMRPVFVPQPYPVYPQPYPYPVYPRPYYPTWYGNVTLATSPQESAVVTYNTDPTQMTGGDTSHMIDA